jgi:hypothetical protein
MLVLQPFANLAKFLEWDCLAKRRNRSKSDQIPKRVDSIAPGELRRKRSQSRPNIEFGVSSVL